MNEPTVPFNLRARVGRLEEIVCVLARGILLHEYSKDLCRGGVEAACKALANDGDIKGALAEIENDDPLNRTEEHLDVVRRRFAELLPEGFVIVREKTPGDL